MVEGEEGLGEGIAREFEINMYTRLYLKWITNKDLLYSTGSSAHVMCQPGWEGSLRENEYMIYKRLSPSAVHLKLSPRC